MPTRSLPARFAQVSAVDPKAVAVSVDGVELSFSELDDASDALALRLVRRGVRPGALVGLVVGRTLAAAVGILGILKAGAAYVPLDPAYPVQRLRMMVADARIDVVVGDPEAAARFGVEAGHVEEALRGGETGAADDASRAYHASHASHATDAQAALPDPGPDDPAYVIYTSGSTGRPKGCVVTHGNVLALLDAALPLFDLRPGERWSLFHSISFDFSVWEFWGALASGGTSVIVPDRAAASPEEFAAFVARERISVLNQVPSVFRSVAAAHRQAGSPALDVRYLVFGGESVDLDVVHRFLATQPDARRPTAVNMYGITETTVHATFKQLTPDDLAGPVRSPIGRPLGHLEIELRGASDAGDHEPGQGFGELVAPGEPGEMWLSGPGVAAGYLHRPELTEQRFVTVAGRRWYRSGDLARRLPDGELEYVGRADQQVKLRGFRVELGEIEAVLRTEPGVREAAVGVVTTAAGAQILVGYLVQETDQAPDSRALKAAVARVLPAYMVPARFVVLDALPLTPSGKLDRAALAGPRRG